MLVIACTPKICALVNKERIEREKKREMSLYYDLSSDNRDNKDFVVNKIVKMSWINLIQYIYGL